MKTKDHDLLGRFLLEQHGASPDPICRSLFLLGCTEPDWNPLTYTRGSVKHRFMHGHNAENAGAHLARLTRRLQESGVRTPFQWFRFGAALHYLADSFTFVHNRMFTGSLKEHRLYERLLHPVFVRHLQEGCAVLLPADGSSHRAYLNAPRSYQTDCRYILGTAMDLCSRLSVQWTAESRRSYPASAKGYRRDHCV